MKPKKKPARFVADRGFVLDTELQGVAVTFWGDAHPHPRTAARAEARRLNAWWERKRRVRSEYEATNGKKVRK